MAQLLTEQVNVRMPQNATDIIKQAAAREYISPGAYIRRIIMRELEPELKRIRAAAATVDAKED